MLKTISGALALAAAFSPALPAFASDSRVVRYDDLNLASPAGQERLQRRIDSAARDVCGGGSATRESLAVLAQTQKCIAQAKTRAQAQVARVTTNDARGG